MIFNKNGLFIRDKIKPRNYSIHFRQSLAYLALTQSWVSLHMMNQTDLTDNDAIIQSSVAATLFTGIVSPLDTVF